MTAGGRLWIITRKHPPSVGGMQELSYRTTRQLALRRPVTVLSWGRSQLGLPLFAGWAGLRLLAALLRRKVSVLLIGDPVLAALGWLAARFRVPVLCVVHGLDVTWPNPLYQAYLRAFFWQRIDAYLCISEYTADRVRERGVPARQVFVVPVGVADPEPGPEPASVDGDPVLLLLGRLVPRKGAAWFVREVLPALARAFPALRLLIAGEGAERANIEAAARERSVADRVVLVGAVDDRTKWSLLARCDAVLMPNVPVPGDAEGFGLVALEAGVAGKPVFAADIEGIQDAVTHGVNGWRLPAGDAAAWLQTLTLRLGDRWQLKRQGEIARDHVVRNFSWESIGERYAAIVELFGTRR
jgi:phosphatidylinositol alpha-1,6-mannosyltransferase